MKKQLYKAHLEKDVYEKAAEILKKKWATILKISQIGKKPL